MPAALGSCERICRDVDINIGTGPEPAMLATPAVMVPLVFLVALLSSCGRKFEPRYDRTHRWFRDLNSVPIIAVVTIQPGAVTPIGRPFRAESVFEGRLGLFRVRVAIENVLKGNVSRGPADMFYCTTADVTGPPKLGFYGTIPFRNLLLLRKEKGSLRTITDISTDCRAPIYSGSHLNLLPKAGEPLGHALIDLLLTRGSGADDIDMVRAVFGVWAAEEMSMQYTAQKLLGLATTEPPVVRTAACLQLRDMLADAPLVGRAEAQSEIAKQFGISEPEIKKWRAQLEQNNLARNWWSRGLDYWPANPPPTATRAAESLSGLALCRNDEALGVLPLHH